MPAVRPGERRGISALLQARAPLDRQRRRRRASRARRRASRSSATQLGVPHVFGKTETDVMFGAGWAAAEDRGAADGALPRPGAPRVPRRARARCVLRRALGPAVRAERADRGVPDAQAKLALLGRTARAAPGADGRRRLRRRHQRIPQEHGLPVPPWTRNDVIAITCLLGARFGAGGGDEARRSEFLSALQSELGAAKGLSVWNDLREQNDPETPTTLDGELPVRAAGRRSARPRQRGRRRRLSVQAPPPALQR